MRKITVALSKGGVGARHYINNEEPASPYFDQIFNLTREIVYGIYGRR